MVDYTHTSDLKVQGKVETSTQGRLIGSMDTLPAASSMNSGCIVLYTGSTANGLVNGKYYISNGTSWNLASSNITAGEGIAVSGNTVSLATSGVTAASKGSTTSIPTLTVDKYGRVTALGSVTIYPPTSAGTANQYWKSDGSGQGVWTTPATSATSGNNTLISSGAVYTELEKKVTAETGKGLSTNDYTTAEKNKLAGIASGAQVNVLETVKVNGTALTPTSKAVDINLSGYSTNANTISGLSVSGTTITYTKADGSSGTITTQDTNTDTKVTQTNSTSSTAYPILVKNGTGTGTITSGTLFNSGVTLTPSTGTITATKFKGALEGNANTATKATQDANGNAITTTYLAKSGGTMTGALVAQTNTSYTTRQVRNVVYSTAEPTSNDGSNGDMWAVYE